MKTEKHIYIACLSSFATGGTELLHQLGSKLKGLGFPVKMYYYNHSLDGKKEDPVPLRFKKYNVDYTLELFERPGDIIVIPEIATHLVNQFKYAQPFIWWLSVDFYLVSIKHNNFFSYKKTVIKNILNGNFKTAYKYMWFKAFNPFSINNKNPKLLHLVQSQYAYDFLLKQGLESNKIFYLSDFLNEEFINSNNVLDIKRERVNRVLYNPLKGIDSTNKIIKECKEIEFIPLQNLTPLEVANLMRTSKVYIDFGHHPGKDRIPREAAISGAIVITNKKGSAMFYEDIPIDEKYKIVEAQGFEQEVKSLINDIFHDYNTHYKQFSNYREMIKNEEGKFERDLGNIFQLNVLK